MNVSRLPRLHADQEAVATVVRSGQARFCVLACGRRWGKTTLARAMAVEMALPGSGGLAWWVAPSYPMAQHAWRALKSSLAGSWAAKSEVDRRIELRGGGSVQVKSADRPDSLRGEGLDFAVLDECAFMAEEAWTEALRPALADRQGGAMFISTPKGRNWFWRLYQRSKANGGGEWRAWRFPTSANPYIEPREIEAARASMPERVFAQEFMAEFLEDGGAVFRRIREAATATPQEGAEDGHDYIIGVDWGKHNDWTVCAVLDVNTGELVACDRFNRIDYAVQRGRLRALCSAFDADAVVAERNAMGEPIIEELIREGLPVQPFTTTNASKAAAIDALALAFEQGTLKILDDDVLIGELMAYTATRLPSGMLRYEAPSGMHDDCVMALALAWHGADTTIEGPLMV